MNILMTDFELSTWTGSKIVLRDFARKLSARGHSITLFSTKIGPAAARFQEMGFQVVDDLAAVKVPPSIIHGHHNIPTVMAMAYFPNVPVIWFCHSAHWPDIPPKFSRIYRYIAVDEFRFAHVEGNGIDRSRIELLHNAVDLTRFPPRDPPLADRPRRALAFTKYTSHIPTLRIACRRKGLTFEALGRGGDRIVLDPERYLAKADIVFAVDRSAIEAICAGAAVIVGDARGLAGMATMENYEELRSLNFGTTSLKRPVSLVSIEKEIDRFDAGDAIAVTNRLRRDADLEAAVDRVEGLYAEAIAASRGRDSADDDAQALSDFLRDWPVGPGQLDGWTAEKEYLTAISRRFADARGRHVGM